MAALFVELMKVKKTKICIVGAGPGGAATALKLSHLGIPSMLIDKAVFPREKTCGDALSGKVPVLLNRMDPSMMDRFIAKKVQTGIWGIKFVAPNNKEIDIPFQDRTDENFIPAPGYVAKRVDFDNFLIEEVRRRDDIDLHLNTEIVSFEKTGAGYLLKDKTGEFAIETNLLIVADGAHSRFARHIAGLEKDPAHHAASVRAYFKNVAGTAGSDLIELHFIKDIIPGYFWIFPLPGNEANVGIGMRSDFVKKNNINLRKSFEKVIKTHPVLKERFKNAEQISPVQGYGLPLGSKKRAISGEHYMLVGDAGHLIDPLTGEGVGNAIYSGIIAAEQAQKCVATGNFTAETLKAYDVRIARVLGSEMKLSYRLQKMLAHTKLVNFLANFIVNNPKLIKLISRMYTDFELRKQLVNPVFWGKVVLGKKL